MSGYGIGYDLAKEKQARLMREAANARVALNSTQVQNLPWGLRSLLILLIPLN
jgi:hypothetical protein